MRLKLNGTVTSNNEARIYRLFGLTDVCCPGDIRNALDSMPEGEELELEINSGGGSVYMGFEMYSALRDAGRPVTAKIYGIAGSAMSVVICACEKVQISPVGNVMIHRASAKADGNSRDMKEAKQMLDTIDESILNAYEAKSGGKASRNQLKAWMRNETFFTAQEAIDAGLADELMFQEDEYQSRPMAAVASLYGEHGLGTLPPVETLLKAVGNLGTGELPQPEALEEGREEPANETKPDAGTGDGTGEGNKETQEGREEMEITNMEELRAAYPELADELAAEAAGAERERISQIHALSMAGYEDLINAAVADPAQTAGSVAMAILTRQKEQGGAYLKGLKQDAEQSGANDVPEATPPEGKTDPENPTADAKAAVEQWTKNGGAI